MEEILDDQQLLHFKGECNGAAKELIEYLETMNTMSPKKRIQSAPPRFTRDKTALRPPYVSTYFLKPA